MYKTNRIIYYLALLALVYVGYIFFSSYFLWFVMLTMVFVPVVSLVMVVASYKGISFDFNTGDYTTVKKDEEMILWLNIKNKSPFPVISLDVEYDINNRFYEKSPSRIVNCSVAGFSTKKIGIPIVPKYSGLLIIESKSMTLRSFLSIVSLKKNTKKTIDISVLPKDISLEVAAETYASAEADFDSENKANDGYDVIDIRKYQMGDKLHKIHWKLSIKKDEILVKEQADMMDNNLVLLVELANLGDGVLDELLDSMYTFVKQILKSGTSCYLCFKTKGEEQLKTVEIASDRELDLVLMDIYLSYPSDEINSSYQGYIKEFSALGGVIYIAPSEVEGKVHGTVLSKPSNRVVVMAL